MKHDFNVKPGWNRIGSAFPVKLSFRQRLRAFFTGYVHMHFSVSVNPSQDSTVTLGAELVRGI